MHQAPPPIDSTRCHDRHDPAKPAAHLLGVVQAHAVSKKPTHRAIYAGHTTHRRPGRLLYAMQKPSLGTPGGQWRPRPSHPPQLRAATRTSATSPLTSRHCPSLRIMTQAALKLVTSGVTPCPPYALTRCMSPIGYVLQPCCPPWSREVSRLVPLTPAYPRGSPPRLTPA